MRKSPKRSAAQSRQHPRAERPRPARLRLEALEDRLAPDAGGVTAMPYEYRQLMAWGDAIRSQEELLQLPQFIYPDSANPAPLGAANNPPVSNPAVGLPVGLAGANPRDGAGGLDPGAPGPFTVTTFDYDFGIQAYDPVSIAGTARVELTARIWAPSDLSAGPRPVLLWLHGNHSATYNPTTGASGFSWPPPAGFQPIPNHWGYGSNPLNPGIINAADILASQGYIVVSVSANGANVLGGTNMVPRAELLHRHLEILRDLTTTGTVTGPGVVDDPGTPQDETRPFGDQFVGRLDMTNIGTMGHSRGGDGVVAHYQYETGVNLGSGLPVLPAAERFPIRAVLPLAPVDFNARTINNVPLLVMLPYNDGDVSDLQGQRFYDRSRYNLPGDTAPHHVMTFLGANHNSWNSIWWAEPAARFSPGAFDDINGAPRLTPPEVRSLGMTYFSAFFRTYVGNEVRPAEPQFLPFLTGDAPIPASVIQSTNPVLAGGIFEQFHPADTAATRRDVNRLLNAAALTTNQVGGAVTSSGITAAFSTLGLQAVGSARLTWTTTGGFWQNAIPAGPAADVSRYGSLQFRVSNLSSIVQNFSVVLTDGAGNSASTTVNAQYTDRRSPLFNRTTITPSRNVLNTADIPLSAFAGVNLSDVRSIRFVFDQTSTGDILVTDLMFANRTLGFQVAGTTPGAGATVSTPPSTFTVTFSEPYDPATLDAGDLTVNGTPATSVVATGPTTATFTFATSPVTVQGLQTISLAAGALTRLSDGTPLGAFTATFRFDLAPLTVVSTTPPAGSAVPLPFTQLDVTFSEPIDPASAGTSDLTLSQGTVTAFTVLSPTQVRYTLGGITGEGTLTVTIAAGALTDAFGNPGTAFTGTYTLDIGTVTFPAPRADSPAGSLVYTTTATGLIGPAGDTDSFTINVNANQTIAVVVRPTGTTLRPSVELRDSSGAVVGTATAAAAGQEVYVQLVPTGGGGVFTVVVGGAAGTTGAYSAQVILNAAVEDETRGGSPNDTPATAQGLGPAFLNLNGSAQRAAVLGQTSGTSATSPIWAGIANPVALTLDGGLGVSTTGYRAAGTGQALGRYPNGDDAVVLGNGGRTLLSFPAYLITNAASRVTFAQNEISLLLAGVAAPRVLYFSDVSPDGPDPYLQALAALGITPTVVPQSSTAAPDTYPQFASQLAAGGWDLVVFQQRFWFDASVITPIVNYVEGGGRMLWTTWNRTQVFPAMAPVFAAFGATTTGGANQTTVNQLGSFTVLPDYYAFTLAAGQTVTLALQTAGGATLELRGPDDTPLAQGRAGGTNLTQVISGFVATTPGTYYARVTGAQLGVDYTLVVTRNADFDTEPNNEFLPRAAQPLGPAVDGVQTSLGSVVGGGGGVSTTARVLYFSDVSPAGDDPYLTALAGLGITPTVVPQSSTAAPDTYPQFVTQLTTGTWDLVIFQQRFWSSETIVTPIVNYVNGGGRLIYTTWNRSQVFAYMAPVFAALGANTSGTVNQTVVTQVPSPLWDGLPNPLTFTLNGGLGVSTNGYTLTTGTALGRWANGDAAVVSANDGRTLLTGIPPYLVTGGFATATTLARNEVGVVLGGISDSDVYQTRAAAGTVLRVTTSTPLTGPGQPGNPLNPRIRLYAPDGTLVAEDDDSAGDGVNATLTYTVPEGGDGLYFIEVLAVGATRGEYVLTVEGGDNGLSAFAVTATTPIDRARLNVAPTTLTVTFSTNVLLTSLDASDLTVDGRPATAFTVLDGGRVQFTLPTGLGEGLRVVDIAAGAVTSVDGTPLTAYTATFFLDTIGPRVVSSSVQEGDVLSPGSLTYVVQFDEPLDSSVLDAADFTLRGNGRAVNYTPSGFSYDAGSSTLTITYSGLPEDNYTLTLLSSLTALRDLTGNPLDGETVVGGTSVFPIPPGRSGNGSPGGNFVLNFVADAGVTAFPGRFTAVSPLGSLVYRAEALGFISPAGDTDGFTLNLDGGQTITVRVTPQATGLRPTVEVRDADGNLVGSATAPAAGQPALLQTVAVPAGGTYTVTVSAAAGTGAYAVQVTLNAALEAESNGGPTNNTRATAQDVTGFTALPRGADRAAVLGRTDAGANYSAAAVTPAFEDIGTTGTILTALQGADDATAQITTAQLGGFTFTFYGVTYNTLFVSSNGLITFGSGDASFVNTDLTTSPTQAAIAPYWDDFLVPASAATGSVRFQVLGSGATQRLVVQWTNVTFFGGGSSPLTFQAVLNADGSIQFNYLDLNGGLPGSDEGGSATVGVKAAGPQGPNRLLVSFNQAGTALVGSNRSTRLNPPGPATSDFFAVTLDAGQSVSLALASLSGGALTLELQDADGTVLATGRTGAANLARVINNFRVAAAGTYFINVGGGANLDYSLVVTRNADFDTENNNTAATAQDITGVVGSLGYVAAGGSTAGARVLYFSDVSPAGADPYLLALAALGITPTVVPQSSTAAPDTYPQFVTQLTTGTWDLVVFQQRFWFDASVVTPLVDYVNGGGRFLYSTWNRTQVFPAMAPLFAALGLNTSGAVNQTVLTQVPSPIWEGLPNPLTFTLDSGLGVSTNGFTLTTGTALGRWANGDAAVVSANGGRTLVTGYAPYLVTGGLATTLAQNEISFLLGGVSDEDWYRVDAVEGQELEFFTVTPGDGPGEFDNPLDVRIELYGPDGSLIATGTPEPDGRNERIRFTVPAGGAGVYRIRVVAESGAGEYFLDPVDAAADGTAGVARTAKGTDGAALAALPTAVYTFDALPPAAGAENTPRPQQKSASAGAVALPIEKRNDPPAAANPAAVALPAGKRNDPPAAANPAPGADGDGLSEEELDLLFARNLRAEGPAEEWMAGVWGVRLNPAR